MTLRGRQICSSGLQLFISPLKSHLMQLQQSRRAPASASLDPVFRLTIGTGDTFIARRPISLRAAPKHVQSYSADVFVIFLQNHHDVRSLCQTTLLLDLLPNSTFRYGANLLALHFCRWAALGRVLHPHLSWLTRCVGTWQLQCEVSAS